MKNLLILFFFLFSLSLSAQRLNANDNKYNAVTFRCLSPLKVGGEQGLSGAFAGTVADEKYILVAGGCNFPNKPLTEGGEKVFYKDIYKFSISENEQQDTWSKVGEMPHALAYGASVSTPQGIVCIGGTNGKERTNQVFFLSLDNTGKLIQSKLPPLPVAMENMAASYGDGYVYVAGGETNKENTTYAFRLAWSNGKTWQRLPNFYGKPRIQPTSAMQNNANGLCFYLMGGYYANAATGEVKVHTDGVFYDPRKNKWENVAPIIPYGRDSAMALVGAQAISSGFAHIVFFGGVNRSIFEKALSRQMLMKKATDSLYIYKYIAENNSYLSKPVDWYQFNDELLIYHTITNTWVTENKNALLARAGASVVKMGKEWIIIGGEKKPGVRANDVTDVEMSVRTDFGWLNWTVLICYLIGMLLLGYYFMKREGNSNDFFTSGGRIPWWAAGISIYATMLSAITYMAYPAKAYATNWTYYPMLIMILFVSFPVIKYYLPFFRRLKVASAYEYLERRFNTATRLMASALFIVFMIARMALVVYLPSLALTAVTGIDLNICIVLMTLVTVVYCTMGGIEAVVWGDVVQGIILVGGAFIAVFYLAFSTEGGISSFFTIGMEDEKFRMFDWSLDYRSATFWVILLGGFANNLISYTSDQTVIQRYLTTKDEKSAGRSIMMNGIMSVVISIIFFAIGTGLYTFFKTHPAELDYTMEKSDTIFPFFMMSQLPQGLAGLLIAAIFAATMSTISSNINSVATAFSVDFYKRLRPQSSDKKILKVARITCFVSGIIGMAIALLMASWNILSLLDFFQEILGLLSSGLGGLFLMGIFFPRIGGRAALVGFITGVVAVFMVRYLTDTSFLLYGFIGMVISVFVAYIYSFIDKEKRNLCGLTWKERNL